MNPGGSDTEGEAVTGPHPDVVDDGGSFALGSFWVSDQVVPGAENPPAEGEVFIRGAGEAQARVLRHSAGEKPKLYDLFTYMRTEPTEKGRT